MSPSRSTLQRVGIVLLWLVTVWETFTIGIAGFAKFCSAEAWARWFDSWGYPPWFMSLVGGVELAGAVLLLVPAIASYAASALTVVMLGALFTVVTKESGGFTAPPIVLHLVGLSIVSWFRRPAWVRRPGP